jgi:hypothetical protein
VSSASQLTLLLANGKGKIISSWIVHTRSGLNALALTLPKAARKAGRDSLRISATGLHERRPLTVVVKA